MSQHPGPALGGPNDPVGHGTHAAPIVWESGAATNRPSSWDGPAAFGNPGPVQQSEPEPEPQAEPERERQPEPAADREPQPEPGAVHAATPAGATPPAAPPEREPAPSTDAQQQHNSADAEDDALTIGRSRGNSIVLDDMLVSRKHLRITADDEGLLLEDLHSRNGTFVNGRRVERTRLHEGDRIGVGAAIFEVRDGWLVTI